MAQAVKIGRNWLLDDGSGYSIRYPSKAAVEAVIAKRERIEAEAVIHRAEVRSARLIAIKAYLAVREARRAEVAKQFAFDF